MTDKIPYISSFYIQPDNKITKKLLENNQYLQRKEAFEIELIKKANNIAEKSFLELLNEVKIGKTEKELAALFDYIMATAVRANLIL